MKFMFQHLFVAVQRFGAVCHSETFQICESISDISRHFQLPCITSKPMGTKYHVAKKKI